MLITGLLLAGCGTGAVASVRPATSTPDAAEPTERPTPSPTATRRATEPPIVTPEPEPETGRFVAGDTITVTQNGDPWADITIDQVKVITQYKTTDQYGSPDVPAKGNVYIQAFVTYKALANGVDYNQFDWQVFADGRAVDGFTYVGNGPKPELSSGTLPKGRVADGWVVYEVPAKGEVLMSYGGSFGNEAPVFEVVLREG